MNSCKVVTVCSSDSGYFSFWSNSFNPDRRNLSRGERRFVSSGKSRIQSAPLASILKPVQYSEFKNSLPKLVAQKRHSMNDRSGSVDSDTLRNEINSAVRLLESRNEADMVTSGRHNATEKESTKYHYKVHDRKQLSLNAQKSIERRIQNDMPRWQSAKVTRDLNCDMGSKKCHLRLLSSCDYPVRNAGSSCTKSSVLEPEHGIISKDIQPELIVSNSNSITNFITIDDLSGAKKYWIEEKRRLVPDNDIQELKPTVNSAIEEKPVQIHKTREDVLRQYMDVYMRWRTINAIEEHEKIVRGRPRDHKSAKIRGATPKQRLEQFKNAINEGQSLVRKTSKAFLTNISNDSSYTNMSAPTGDDILELSSPVRTDDKESVTDKVACTSKEEETASKMGQIAEDSESDAYSEIDWLECEDL